MDADWRQWLEEYPELGTICGYPGFNDRWTDDSPTGIERRRRHLADALTSLRAFEPASLERADRTNFDLYTDLLETATRGLEYGDDPLPFRLGMAHNLWMPINQMEGVHASTADMLALQPAQTRTDFEAILARLDRVPTAIDQNLELLRKGRAAGYTPPRVAIRGVPDQVRDLMPDDAAKSAYLRPFAERPALIPEAEWGGIVERGRSAYTGRVRPALVRLREYIESEYLPACRDGVAASDLPSGRAGYDFHVRWQTTVPLSAEEIHAIGLREVARLRSEMEKVRAETGFTGTLLEFFAFLRSDSRFFYHAPEELIDGYRVIAKTIDPGLAKVFGSLPRLPYGIEPIPDFRAPSSPTAYYLGGAAKTGRPGIFYANTFDLNARPRWEMEALALHEAVPGHHLQIALMEELGDLPEFRRYTGYTAYIEGWGLYAESLGSELGMYRDPYSRMGQLIYDMWRSIRLVVDTGMHALGWSRDRAIEFFRQNAGKAELDITNEVDRYIVWPGQALAYKIGQLKFRELRTRAEGALGDRFDVRQFHDRVLSEGGLPLAAVEERVVAWIDERRASTTA